MYDLTIIGGGPAAVAAGVYAARKHLTTLVIAKEFAGQSVVSPDIQNWIGTPHISGTDLAANLRAHLEEYRGEHLKIVEGCVEDVRGAAGTFEVVVGGATYTTATVLVASGATRRKLSVPGADTFEGKGLTYCATCDGPLFSGMDVAVIGGGNAGFETAAQLLAYATNVTILEHGSSFRADAVTVTKVLAHPHAHGLVRAKTTAVTGDTFVQGLTYEDVVTGDVHTLAVQGIFVEIGVIPSTSFVAPLVARDEVGRIIVDPRRQRTSCTGIWAAGDCTDGLYAQNNIAAGDAVKAVEDIYAYLRAQ